MVPSIVYDGNMCKVHDVYSVSADHLLRFSLLASRKTLAVFCLNQCLNFILLLLVAPET